MARACIFCGGTPLTKEHLWPNWLRRKIQVAPFPHRLKQEIDGTASRDVSFEHPPFDQQVRAVCASCNNGWMAQVEGRAKLLLEPLLGFSGRSLHRRQQRELATWALMKAIVFDQLHPGEQAVLAEHRQTLFDDRQPPREGLWIWLATYNAEQVAHYAYQGLKLTPPGITEEPEDPTVYTVTFTVGPVAVQLAGTNVDGLSFDDIVFPQLDAVRIWPSLGNVSYDQRVVMTTRTLEVFSTAIYDDLGKRSAPSPPPAA